MVLRGDECMRNPLSWRLASGVAGAELTPTVPGLEVLPKPGLKLDPPSTPLPPSLVLSNPLVWGRALSPVECSYRGSVPEAEDTVTSTPLPTSRTRTQEHVITVFRSICQRLRWGIARGWEEKSRGSL